MNPLILLMGSFFILLLLKVPIVFTFIISSAITLVRLNMNLMSVVNHVYASIDSFSLLAVPFFLLLGQLMNYGGITERLVKLSNKLVGHIRVGLGHVNVLVSMLFAGLSGSSVADTAGIGAMLIPAMKKAGYSVPFSAAITASSSVLGGIIPPSIIMVIYASLARISIGALFLAGVIPGVLIAFSQMAYTYYVAIRNDYQPIAAFSLKEAVGAIGPAIPPLMMPLIIIGGISAGVFTATEAAAVAVVYGLLLILVVYRSISVRELPGILGKALVDYSLPMMAVGASGIMGWLIAYLDAPELILSFIMDITEAPFGIAMLIVLFLLVLGTFLSPIIVVVVFLPILQAMGAAANMEPVHLGIIVVLTLSLGRITPPYGICMLVAAQIAEMPSHRVFIASIPMIVLALGIIVIGIVFPGLFLAFPRLLMPEFL